MARRRRNRWEAKFLASSELEAFCLFTADKEFRESHTFQELEEKALNDPSGTPLELITVRVARAAADQVLLSYRRKGSSPSVPNAPAPPASPPPPEQRDLPAAEQRDGAGLKKRVSKFLPFIRHRVKKSISMGKPEINDTNLHDLACSAPAISVTNGSSSPGSGASSDGENSEGIEKETIRSQVSTALSELLTSELSNILSTSKDIASNSQRRQVHSVTLRGCKHTNEDRIVTVSYVDELAGSSAANSQPNTRTLSNTNVPSSMTDLSNVGLYAVYDGHGGDLTSQYLATFLHINLLRHQSFPTDTRKALIDTFLETNEEMRRSLKRENHNSNSGSTATVAVMMDNKVSIAWTGDSPAFLFRKDGSVQQLLHYHSPDNLAERERVEQLGGVFIPVADDSLGKSHSAMYLNNLGGPGVGGGYSDTESINSEYNTSMASSMHLVIPRDGSNHVASMGMKHYHSTPAILHEGNGSGAGGHTSKVEAGSSVHQDQRAGEAEPAVTQTEALPRVYYRLNGLVSVTRAFGDFRISCMTAEPEVVEFTVDPERDCFLLLCSDGLIDTMSPSDIWTFIEQFKKKSEKHNGDAADETKEKQQDKEEDDPGDVGAWGRGTDDWMSDDSSTSLAEALAKAAIDRGSGDNVSVIIIYI